MIGWLMYGFEELVLRTFVVLQTLLLWTFSGIFSGAMYVPGARRLLDRFSPPHSAAGASPAPSDAAPAGMKSDLEPGWSWCDVEMLSEWILMMATGLMAIFLRAHEDVNLLVIAGWYCWTAFGNAVPWPSDCPRSPTTRKPANRSARSVRGCLVEAFLSAVVFVYTARGMAGSPTALELLALFIVLGSTLRGAKAGFYHVVRADFAEIAVDLTAYKNGDRVQPDGTVSLNRHSVDLFEYADMAALSRINATAIAVVLWALVIGCDFFASFVGSVALSCLALLYTCAPEFFREAREFLDRPNLQDISGTRPSYMAVRCFLLLSGLAYAGSLCFSPGPYLWKGSLIVTHNTRLLNLLVSLRGRNGGRVDAAAVSAQHVREQ